jgi:hypothetical protein
VKADATFSACSACSAVQKNAIKEDTISRKIATTLTTIATLSDRLEGQTGKNRQIVSP